MSSGTVGWRFQPRARPGGQAQRRRRTFRTALVEAELRRHRLFGFDREQLFIGSMNFDQRCRHSNTEIGLIIDSPVLAQQTAMRFEAMVQPGNAYALA
jgi:phosphatidylserine/phosphatidylglycerophosphate/cardiolipin synthase-like enzyme